MLAPHRQDGSHQILIPRHSHLLGRWQIHQELQGMGTGPGRRVFLVPDASAGGHPLGIARTDHPTVSGAVAMLDRPLDDECNRLDAAMRVKREYPLGRPILGHQDERIGERGVRCVDQTASAVPGALSRCELGIVDARYFSNKHRFGGVHPESL
jgi:hypothetical protein